MITRVRLGFIIVLVLAVTVYLIVLGTGTRMLARQATGCGISESDQKYWISTGIAAENGISCTKEQYYNYTGDPDVGRTDTLFLAIYEQNKLIPSKQNIIKVKKFHDEWDDSIHLRIIKGTTYYRLVDESLEKADDKHSVFSRLYECYYKDGSQMILDIESVVIPYFNDIKPAKEWILNNNSDTLKLRPLTIVDDEIIAAWEKQGYNTIMEYHDESPEGLAYESISRRPVREAES